MAHRKLAGRGESLDYEEARKIRDETMTDFLFNMAAVVDEAVEDEDERAEAKVNLSAKLEKVISSSELVGALVDPDYYLQDLRKYDDTIRIEEDADGERESDVER